ncbi:hypothetical protein ERS140147_00356 [Staphylococcus schweitzeri]|uniref:Uncharacterized protein n=1 Tax=Staphylococcus schweitzeri TaxID=1654388 RepID=A0A077UF35_9STAP|nr:hypothetical protein ERS140147_00356 [Staphylococcus schweitzeri]CDR50888.1 hypothetical protein ERS140159_00829 [Staphylococcus schweitzeri]
MSKALQRYISSIRLNEHALVTSFFNASQFSRGVDHKHREFRKEILQTM